MKELEFTDKEIRKVEQYLNKKELYYVDIRYEILDHILLDIEHQMKDKKLSFDNAFKNACDKWKGSFYKESSYWLGIMFRGPRVFIDSCVKIQRPFLILYVVSILSFVLFSVFIKPVLDFELLFNLTLGITSIYCSLVLYWWVKMKISRTKTSFSFLFNRYIIMNFIMNFLILYQLYNTPVAALNLTDFSYLIFVFNILFNGHFLYKNHQKEVSQYNKYKML